MRARFALIFFCLFAANARGIAAQATLYSSSSTARTFSRCVVDRLCQSEAFIPDERVALVGVADVMDQGLRSLERGNRGPVSVKILLQAFVTSLADIVIHGDGSRTSHRQNAYSTAIEQCSLSTIDRVDIETVSESLRILYSLEDSQIASVREEITKTGFFEPDVVPPRFNPPPLVVPDFPSVIPSPVQRPFSPTNFERNTETAFKPPESPLRFPFSPLPVQSGLFGPPPLGLPPFGTSSSLVQDGSGASSVLLGHIGDYSSLVDSHIAPSFDFGALNLPQTKNSAAYPPMASQMGMNAPFQQLPGRQNFFNQQPIQLGVNMGSPSIFDESLFRDIPAPAFMGIKGNSGQLFQGGPSGYMPYQVGGLNIPQMRESSVRVIPPLIQPQPSDDAFSQEKFLPENVYMPSTSERPLPTNINIFITTSPAFIPEMDEKKYFPGDSTLENIVFKILTNSANFREAFDFGINPQKALNLAQVITERSLTGFDANTIREALNAISEAVARVTVSSPENYANALSDALVHVLKTHNSPLFEDGSKVATSMLSNLDALMQIPPEYTSEQSGEFISPEVYIEGKETQLPSDYQFPATTSGYNNEDIFSKALTQYLIKSDELADFFCQKNFPSDRMKIYFSLFKFSMADFDPQVSSIVASITSGNLLHLPDEVLCSSYAQTISASMAEILGENDLLSQANAESIANKMLLSLRQQLAIPTPVPEKGFSSTNLSSTSLPPKSAPDIQTSFTNYFDRPYQETSALPDIYNLPSTYPSTSTEAVSYKIENIPSVVESTIEKAISPPHNTSSSVIQKSSIDVVTESNTSSYTSEMDVAHIASTTEFMYPSTTETSSDAAGKIPGISGDSIDKEKLSAFLSKEMESVVSAISDEVNQQDKNSGDALRTESKSIRKNDEFQVTENSQVVENPDIDYTTTSDVHVIKVRSSPHHSVSNQSIEYSNTTDNASIENSSTQYPSTLSKSSFQESHFSDKALAASEKSPYKSDTPASKSNDSRRIFATIISQFAANLIRFVRSKQFNLIELCSKLNVLAPVFDIAPLDYCEESAVIDYLLHVLQSMTRLLKDV